MPDAHSPVSPLVLDRPDGVRVLLDARQRAALLPFMGREHSVSAAARLCGERPNTMLARVRRWQALGLLTAVRQERHARGLRTLYRCTADALFVPYAATAAEDLQTLLQEVAGPPFQTLLGRYARAGQSIADDWGLRFERQGEDWVIRPLQSADAECDPLADAAPAALLDLAVLTLEPERAKALQRDLRALLEMYAAPPTSARARRYHLLLGLA